MKNYICKINVKSLFWEDHNVSLQFNDGNNCIFGINGTGKTTIINLLVSTINVDIDKISIYPFTEFEIWIAEHSQNVCECFIKLIKTINNEIIYIFPSLDNIQDHIFKTDSSSSENDGQRKSNIRKLIKTTIKLTHVPLSRIESRYFRRQPPPSYMRMENNAGIHYPYHHDVSEPLATEKIMIEQISNDFKETQSILNKRINEESEQFQKTIARRFLINESHFKATEQIWSKWMKYSKNDFRYFNADQLYKKFEAANIDISKPELESHLNIIKQLSEDLLEAQKKCKLDETKENMDKYTELFFAYFSLKPLVERFLIVIDDIGKLERSKNEKLQWVTDFEKTVNGFLNNKIFSFNSTGGFKFKCSNNKELAYRDLSSGEKHMIAILGRVALSPRTGSIFVADEPELSLHLEWQRKIIPSINKLNPNMQVIVATHSPAIITKNSKMVELEAYRKC